MPEKTPALEHTWKVVSRAISNLCSDVVPRANPSKRTPIKNTAREKPKKERRPAIGPIPTNIVTDKRGYLLLAEQLLRNNIMPSEPISDLCYDVITTHRAPDGSVRNMRVQVRSTCQHATGNSLKFPILRSKRKKAFFTEHPDSRSNRSFREDDLDAFAFVQPDRGLFFIVPARHVDFTKTKFTVRVGDKWHNAWHHLKLR
jgi:hypothetical protein